MESWLIRITEYLLAQSWQIAVLTVAVAAASFLLRNRSAHVRYLLWLVVLAKCLVPPLHSVPLAVLPQERPPASVSAPLAETLMVEHGPPEAAVTEPVKPVSIRTETGRVPEVMQKPGPYSIRAWLAVGWLAGALALLAFNLLNALRTQVWLQRQRRTLPVHFRRDIESFFSAHGLKRMRSIWLLDGISQPFVWGLVRGSIYLPLNFADLKDRNWWASLLGHEISHIMRFDATVNSLQVVAQIVFWFHPFVWWANRKIRAEREKCCDEMTIAGLHAPPEDYSEAIVETLAAKHEQVRPVPSLAVAGPAKNIEERIKTMMKPGKKFYKRPSLVAATTAFMFALLTVPTGLVLTARAETKAATEPAEKPTKSLHQAAKEGDIEQVKLLISKGTDVNARDWMGKTALHSVAEKGHLNIVKFLVVQGADINAVRFGGQTVLHGAAGKGHADVVKFLIDRGADVNARTRSQETALHSACMHTGNEKTVELLIDKGVDVNAKNAKGERSLHYAAMHADKQTVELLLSKGADVDVNDTRGSTPLYWAMTSSIANRRDIVELLLAKGARVSAFHVAAYMGEMAKLKKCLQDGIDVNSQEDAGGTALHLAASSGKKDVLEFLLAKGATVDVKDVFDLTPLFYAASHNCEDIADLLLAKGADVNAKDQKRGYTLLYHAISGSSKDAIKLLISKGASVNVQDTSGFTPLTYAVWMGDRDTVELLISKGADVNTEDKGGLTPLYWASMLDGKELIELLTAKGAAPVSTIHVAAAAGDLYKVKSLIDKGSDVNAKDAVGFTALQWAILMGHKDVAAFLIDKGADINVRDKRGETLLHQACSRGHKDKAEFLITKGADVNAKTDQNRTPLHQACLRGHKDMVELLISKGADVNVKGPNGQTPLHLSAQRGHADVVRLLVAQRADLNAKNEWGRTPLTVAESRGQSEIAEFLRKHGAKE